MSIKFKNIETKLVHSGEASPRHAGAVSQPIFQSSTFEYSGESTYHDIRYIRLNNTPNHEVLHRKLADLEQGEAALVTSSGMAAITTTLLTLLGSGDHLLAQKSLYGGTHHFITHDLVKLGIGHDLIDVQKPETWKASVRPTTRVIYVEAISNPLMEVGDLQAIVAFARENNLVSIIDNTFATPVNFLPLELGFDLSVHSATKYLNGHTDLVAGAIIGSTKRIGQIIPMLNHLGGTLDPHACFLLHRGMKTLSLRVNHQNQSALRLAQILEKHPAVSKVNYPGLESSPFHSRSRNLFSGFGGMLSFELRGQVDAASQFMKSTQIPIEAPSLGGVETLVTRPCTTSHSGMTSQEREAAGISDGLIRVSVGIEACQDLIDDFSQALDKIQVSETQDRTKLRPSGSDAQREG